MTCGKAGEKLWNIFITPLGSRLLTGLNDYHSQITFYPQSVSSYQHAPLLRFPHFHNLCYYNYISKETPNIFMRIFNEVCL